MRYLHSLVFSAFLGILIGTIDGILSVNGFGEGNTYYILLYAFILAFSSLSALNSHEWFARILLFAGSAGVITGFWALQWMIVAQIFQPAVLQSIKQAGVINLGMGMQTTFSMYILSTIAQLFGGLLCYSVLQLLLFKDRGKR